MSGDRSSQTKYTLPTKFEELLDQKHFTYVSIFGTTDEDVLSFVIWLPKPLNEVRTRAEAFIRRLYGRDLTYYLYQRKQVRKARSFARLGMHEDAPLEVCKSVLHQYKELREAYDQRVDEQYEREQARLEFERANPRITETGTYIGPVKGASLCVWRDRFGYTHIASDWMHKLRPGQKFIEGEVVDLSQDESDLAPIKGSGTPSDTLHIFGKHNVANRHEVPGVEISRPRTLVLSWQGDWIIGTPRHVHQDGDPLMEVVEFDSEVEPRVIGACGASLFYSKITERDALEGLFLAWGISTDALDEVQSWLESRISSASYPSPSRSWPLSRLAMFTEVELADLGKRHVTLYAGTQFGFGRRRIEVTDLQVTRAPYAQYTDAFFVQFKPRRKRRFNQIIETYQPQLVALLGWEHPDFQDIMKRSDTVIRGATIQSTKYISFDKRWEQEFDAALRFYLETNPLTRVVLDLRGETVPTEFPDASDVISTSKAAPPELAQPVVSTIVLPESQMEKSEVPSKKLLFVSYHHSQDAINRERFEQDFCSLFESVSIYPGEISKKASDSIVKHDIRSRIKECECVIVLLGTTTYTRRWVDYEIRTALDSKLPGGPHPVVGLLTPELSTIETEIRAEIDVARSKCIRQNYTSREVYEITATLSAEMQEARGFALPARLLDNLLTGHAVLAAWPKDVHQLEVLIMQGRSVIGKPLNSRRLMRTDRS